MQAYLDFVMANRGTKCFRNQTLETISYNLVAHNLNDTLEVYKDGDEIKGIVIWDFVEYFPITICIVEALCIQRGILPQLLQNIATKLPPSFRCIADRKGATKVVEYKNPRRIINLLKLKDNTHGSRP